MNSWQIKEVARREIVTRARSNGYRFITGIMLLLAVAAPVIGALIPTPTDEARELVIGLSSDAPDGLADQLTALAEGTFDLTIETVDVDDADALSDAFADDNLDVAFRAPNTLIWEETEDSSVTGFVAAAVQRVTSLDRALERELDPAELAEVLAPVALEQQFLDETDNTEEVRIGVAMFGLFLAFLLPQVFGQFTMMSVVEEKATRVVEVLLSQIRPATLLAGKILGLCALAVVQLLLIVAGLVASMLVTNFVDIPASVWRFVPLFTLSLLAGLLIYTTLFALLGSLISRQEDQAQVMFPVFAPLMAGYFAGQVAAFGDADTALAKAMTWFPLTAPMLLPVRVARDAISSFEIIGSLAVMTVTAFLLFKLAARVYEFTLLRTGSRVGWGELIRLSRGGVID